MKKNLLIGGIALVLLLSAAYITRHYKLSEPEMAAGSTTKVETADFTLSDLDGNQVTLQELRGKTVFINFWATWCLFCVEEMPDMEKVYQAYKERDVVVLAIAVGENRKEVSDYLQNKGYTFRILLDPDKSVTNAYDVQSIPTSIFIDKEGRVSQKRVGAMDEEKMRAAIDRMLAK
ncbi:TlpA family protein disulfide reductase [Paenibacillus koleovorans]|uniref:TlpA family protein disulfide reductase n=1 Tax=Paenibacillus koleovorans TaxID=121608 RepID=UPI000FD74EE8|nr:TlpA disulfide reductase family protein [Paenibacillus koleovorans]